MLCFSRTAKQLPPTCIELYCSVHCVWFVLKTWWQINWFVCRLRMVNGMIISIVITDLFKGVLETLRKELSFQACNFTLTPVGTVCLYLNRTATTGQCHLQLPWSRYVSSCLQNRSSLLHGAKVHATIPHSPGQTPHEDTDLKTHIQRRYIITKHPN